MMSVRTLYEMGLPERICVITVISLVPLAEAFWEDEGKETDLCGGVIFPRFVIVEVGAKKVVYAMR